MFWAGVDDDAGDAAGGLLARMRRVLRWLSVKPSSVAMAATWAWKFDMGGGGEPQRGRRT